MITVLVFLTMTVFSFSQEKCKIVGFVKDHFTGVILKDVTISITGTSHETSTDGRGRYEFDGVKPGSYSLAAYAPGYLIQRIEVSLEAGDVKAVHFSMVPEGQEDEIKGSFIQNPFRNSIPVSSRTVVNLRDRERYPLRGTLPLLELVPGITAVNGGNAYSFRGSRTDEVGYFIDGMPLRNFYTGNPAFLLHHTAIDRVEIDRGWFDAKYGRITGGMVNVIPKYGEEDYHVNITGLTEGLTGLWTGARNYGYGVFEGSAGGPVYGYPKGRFFVSFEKRKRGDRTPSPLTTMLYPDGRLPGNDEDYYSVFGKVSYLLDDDMEIEAGAGRNSMKYNTYDILFRYDTDHVLHNKSLGSFYYSKFSHRLGENTFYTVKLSSSGEVNKSEDNVHRGDIGEYHRVLKDDYNPVDEYGLYYYPFDESGRYVHPLLATNTWSKTDNSMITLKGDFTHQLTKAHRIEAGFDVQRHTLKSLTINNLNKVLTSISMFSDQNIFSWGFDLPRDSRGYYKQPHVLDATVNGIFYYFDPDDPFFKTIEHTLIDVNSGKSAAKHPLNISYYIQDHIELDRAFINLGLRYDSFYSDSPILTDIYEPIDPQTNKLKLKEDKFTHKLAPRLGIGFRAGKMTDIYSNFGIFYQQPVYELVVLPYSSVKDLCVRGKYFKSNPELKLQKVSAFEFGISQYLYKDMWLHINAFYKSFDNLVGLKRLATLIGYQLIYSNIDYGTSKGFEFELSLRRNRNFNFFVNYSLMYAYGTGSAPESNSRRIWMGEPLPDHPERLDFDRRHKIIADIDYRLYRKEGPRFFGKNILQDSGINVLFRLGSGMPYQQIAQPCNEIAVPPEYSKPVGGKNSRTGPWIFSMDFKAQKLVRIKDFLKLNIFVWVLNITNRINSETVFQTTGKVDYNGWLQTNEGGEWLRIYGEEGKKLYNEKLHDPMKYFNPRIIRFGLEIEF